MRFENSNTYARFDDDGKFIEYSKGIMPDDMDEGDIDGDGNTYYRVFMEFPENIVECPHNFRIEHEDEPVLESLPDLESKRATLRMVLVPKEGDSLLEAQNVTMQQLRDERNRLLEETDFKIIVAVESGDSVPIEWKEYRQQLRDLPSTANVFNIAWPTPPE